MQHMIYSILYAAYNIIYKFMDNHAPCNMVHVNQNA